MRARWYDPSIGRFITEDTYEGELGNPLTLNLYTYVQNNPLKYIDPSGNRYIPPEMNSILEATMKVTSTQSKAYSHAYDLLSREYADVYDNSNRFKYLFDLLTQTSAYKNSAGNADWARAELAKDYSNWHKDISFAEALASLGPVIGGIGKAREVGGKVRAIGGCNCFTAGTKVLTDDGEKSIEEIEVGDKVLAKPDETGEVAYKEVVGLFQKQAEEIYKVHIGDEIIEATVYYFEAADFHSYFVSNLGI